MSDSKKQNPSQSDIDPHATIPPVDVLMQVIGFSRDDLIANHEGTLGHDQQEQLMRLRRRTVIIGAMGFFSFALMATIFLYLGARYNMLVFSFGGILITLINAIFTGIFGRNWMRLNADIQDGDIICLEGILERVVKPSQVSQYILHISEISLDVKKEVFREFRHNIPYRIYRAPRSGILLSAEPLATEA